MITLDERILNCIILSEFLKLPSGIYNSEKTLSNGCKKLFQLRVQILGKDKKVNTNSATKDFEKIFYEFRETVSKKIFSKSDLERLTKAFNLILKLYTQKKASAIVGDLVLLVFPPLFEGEFSGEKEVIISEIKNNTIFYNEVTFLSDNKITISDYSMPCSIKRISKIIKKKTEVTHLLETYSSDTDLSESVHTNKELTLPEDILSITEEMLKKCKNFDDIVEELYTSYKIKFNQDTKQAIKDFLEFFAQNSYSFSIALKHSNSTRRNSLNSLLNALVKRYFKNIHNINFSKSNLFFTYIKKELTNNCNADS